MAATKEPWWQTAKTPRQGFIMGGVWLLFALVQLVATVQEPRVLSSVLLVLAAVLSVTYLVPAVVLLRRQRSAEDESDGEAEVLPD